MTAQIIRFPRSAAPIRCSERTEINVILIGALVANCIVWFSIGYVVWRLFFA